MIEPQQPTTTASERRFTPSSSSRTLRRRWRLLRGVADVAAGLLALALAFAIRIALPLPLTAGLLPVDRLRFLATSSVVVTLAQLVALYFLGFYEVTHPNERAERIRRLFATALFVALALISFYFLTNRLFPRSVLLLFLLLDVSLLAVLRRGLDEVLPPPRRRVLVVGAGADALQLARSTERHPLYGFEIVGYVPAPHDAPSDAGPGELLGTIEDVPALLAEGTVDEVILTSPPDNWQTDLIERLSSGASRRPSVLLLPDPFSSLLGGVRYRPVHDVPLIEVISEERWHRPHPLKRALDLSLASLLLVASAPLLALAALTVKLSSKGPVIYRQDRVGLDQVPFEVVKLRTMKLGAEDDGEELLARREDPRVTPVGRLLRPLRIDELPQLFNVLGGTMSLVGPRPERPGFTRRYLEEIPGYAARFSVRPGLTGLAQIHGDYFTSVENKLRYDLSYISNWSLWLDLAILLRTVRIVLTSRGT